MDRDFIDKKRNDAFAELRGFDLQSLLVQVENYNLIYRDELGLPDDLIFKVGIKYDYMMEQPMNKFIKHSLQKRVAHNGGTEGMLTIYPMWDEPKTWEILEEKCESLIKRNLQNIDMFSNPNDYIKIGVGFFGNDVGAWRKFLKIYALYDHVMARFICEDRMGFIKQLCQLTINDTLRTLVREITDIDDIKCLLTDKYFDALVFKGINFDELTNESEENMITFKSLNAWTDPIIWQNNINAYAKIMISAKQKLVDEEFLDYKLQDLFQKYATHETHNYLYSSVNIKDVMEFVDIVFDNNLDKVYFLKQYFRDFQDEFGIKPIKRVKKILGR